MTATDPVARLADTARALLRGGADERTLGQDEIRMAVTASAPALAIVSRHQFTEEEIEAAIRELEMLFVVSQGPTIRVNGDLRPIPWYFGDRRRPGQFMSRYLQKLAEHGWAPGPIEALAESTAEVMEAVDAPEREGSWDWRGLVVGNVQSGKTAHYAGVINRAADAGYRVIIVLAGMHNILRRQTQLRLDSDFLGYDTGPAATPNGGRRRVGVGLLPGPVLQVDSVTTSESNGDFNKAVSQTNFLPANRPFVFVVKKNASVLQNLNRWIARLPSESRQVPLLVIDDEADQASPDTGEQGLLPDGSFDEDYDPKRINGEIRKLLIAFEKRVYIGYTATPFANILIHDEAAAEEYGPDLFPSAFIFSLAAPDDYFGPLAVFGRDDDADVEGLPLIRYLDQTEEDWIPDPHDKTLQPVSEGLDQVPPSLSLAMRSFIITCAARAARGQTGVHNSMLVHVSRFQDVHDRVHLQVERELRRLRNALSGNDPVELAEFSRMWQDDFAPTTSRILPTVFGRSLRPVGWEGVLPRLADEADRIQVAIANGRSRTGIDYEAAPSGLSVIAIGGDKLSRGLTLEGLSTSYFLRASRQYDSLLQMGRWFGYPRGYADLCRLYTTIDMESWFRHLATVNEDLRAQLAHMRITLATPKQYGLSIATHDVMSVTAANKRRHGVERPKTYAGQGKVQTVLFRDPGLVEANAAAIDAILACLPAPERDVRRPGSGGVARGLLWRDVLGATVADLLNSLSFPPEGADLDGRRMAEYIRRQMRLSELRRWTIMVPSGTGADVLVGGIEIPAVKRTPLPRSSPTRFVVKSILSRMDEAIDLSDGQYARALNETNRVLDLEGKPQVDRPSGPSIRQVRGDDPDRALLIVYPLDPEVAELEGETPLYGVVVSFPSSETGASDDRLDNTVRQREVM